MNEITKKYDVVILTHKPKDELILSLKMLINQSVKPENIIIYNTDEDNFYNNISNANDLKKILSDYDSFIKIVHIPKQDFDHGRARNNASKLCKSDYLLFLTDDAVPYDSFLAEELIKSFNKYDTANSRVAVVYARQIAKNDAKLKEKYVREFNYPEYDVVKDKSSEKELGIKNYFCSNVCAMYDKIIFDKLGMFEENIILNEDTFYAYNAINKGYKVIYCSTAKVLHSHNLSYKEQFSRNFDIGVSQYERKAIFEKIPSAKEGKKMVMSVAKKLFLEFHFIKLIDFIIECLYRYFGFKKGKSFEKLSIDECINYASNKNYFINKKKI